MADARAPAGLLARLAPRKIALLRASRLGDFVCTGPALRALRAGAPRAEIVLVTLPLLRELAERRPEIDRFAAFPGFPGIAQQLFRARPALAFLRRMQAERFDLAVQLQGSGVYANPFTLLLGAAVTAGFVRAEDDPSALDAALVWPEHGHEVERLLALMRHLGAPPVDPRPDFPLRQGDRRAAQALLASLPRPWIGLHAGSHDPRRRWPRERFARVGRALLRWTGGTVLVLGSGAESRDALELAAAIGPGACNLAGCTSLATLGGVIGELGLLVSSDSGPAHIGYALGTPTIGIYRRGGTERYGPPAGGPFVGLEPEDAGEDALVEVAQVLDAAERLIEAPATQTVGSVAWS
jgi:ADP-heptose:LPS heptosyltransferase